jgi:hypothetical protein
MTAITDLIPDIRLEVPGCIDLTITRELRNAAREFCEKTGCWEVILDDVSLVEGQDTYSLVLPGESSLVSITAVTRDGQPFDAYRLHLPDLELVLNHVPTETAALSVTALLMPTRTATTVPDILERDYYDGVRALTLYRLMRQAGVPWNNPSMAAHYKAEARRLMGRATVRRWRERSGEAMHVRPQPFF